MKNMLKTLLVPALFLLTGTISATAQGGCLSGGEIQQAIASGQILPLEDILARNGLSRNNLVGQFAVCDQGGALYYILPVLKDGNASKLVLNARTGTS